MVARAVARAVAAPAGGAPLVKAVAVSEDNSWRRPRAEQEAGFAPSIPLKSPASSAASSAPAGAAPRAAGAEGSSPAPTNSVPEHMHPRSATSLPVSVHSSEKALNAWAEGEPVAPDAAPQSIYPPAAADTDEGSGVKGAAGRVRSGAPSPGKASGGSVDWSVPAPADAAGEAHKAGVFE
jgi:hypothetical protein